MHPPKISSITPVLAVDTIEAVLPFWDALGFEAVVKVPAEGPLDFVILKTGESEVMYQTHKSLAEDLPTATPGTTLLYVQVGDLDAAEAATQGARRLFERRKTFYGALEFGVEDPAGHVVVFSHFATQQ